MLELAPRIIEIIFPIFAIIGLGYAYGRFKSIDMSAVNTLTMDVFVPILVFIKLVQSDFSISDYSLLALGGLVVILGSGLLVWPVIRTTRVQSKTFIPPMMFSNATNIGIPLQVLAFGEQALPAALILVLVFNLLHFSLGIYILDKQANWLNTFKQPVIIAGIAALIFKFAGLSLPDTVAKPMDMMADICIPIMLFSLGVRLTTAGFNDIKLGMAAGITKPLAGVLIALAFGFAFDIPKAHWGNLILFGALPPAIMNFLFAERFNQEPEKVASIVMTANLMGIITLPIALLFVLPIFGNG